ncbi:MFS transporter [Cupriavidus consociatus]|uniref:MFS transporter n=1 Tax=Cupriavidus consociatus TaxID=2821357 RepID=UPI001AEA30D3|nr:MULTISPECIES: MFS transporter [unclassified Cupriavidus]MBP0619246.1 MFS transporter [Cupriavidus sp. LEh25]MDK2655892.1 MFS transporter [Cupriavidus sp. LEh21]
MFPRDLPNSVATENPEADRPGPLSEASLLGAVHNSPPSGAAVVTCPSASVYPGLLGLLAAYGVFIVGNGLFTSAIPFQMLRFNAPTTLIGVVQSCYYGGFILGAFFTRALIERIGQHRAFVAFAATASLFAMAFSLSDSTLSLCAFRLGTGFALMGIYTTVESWLNGSVPNSMRGSVFGSYQAINFLAVGAGQLLLNVGAPGSQAQLLLVIALFTAAVLPITIMQGWPSRVPDKRLARTDANAWTDSVRDMMHKAPVAVPGCILAGLLYGTFYSLMPVYLARSGFSIAELSLVTGGSLMCALFSQWPVGRLSDRMNRCALSARLAVGSACVSLPPVIMESSWLATASTFLFVAMTFTQYGLIASHVNDRTSPEHRVALSAMLIILFSIGGLIGPALVSAMMTEFGQNALHLFNAAASLSLACFTWDESRRTR